jgi:hypothetical protein
MSDYYLCKVLSDKVVTMTGTEMVTAIPIRSNWKEEFLLDVENNASDFGEFYTMIREFISQNGPDKALADFYQCSFFHPGNYRHLSQLLFTDLAKELKPEDCFDLEGYYFGNNLLAELMPKHFKPAPLRQISIDVVTINPDSGFPEDGTLLNKDLCIRILADLEGRENSKLYQWFNNMKPDCFYEPNFGGVEESVYAIMVGAKRTETINMEVESKEFWNRCRNKWWAGPLQGKLTKNSDYKPYQAVNFMIYIHPSWLPERLPDKPFRSIAYAVSY